MMESSTNVKELEGAFFKLKLNLAQKVELVKA